MGFLTPLSSRQGAMRTLLVLLPVLVVYLAVPLVAGPSGPEDDEAVYLRIAERIAEGRYVDPDGSDADYVWYPPGLPLVLTPMVSADLPLDVVRLLGPLALFGAVVAFMLLLRRFVEPRLALLGAYAFAFYPPLFVLLRRTFSEPLALLLITLGMLFTARAVASRRVSDVLVAGAAFGGLALTRAAFGWIVVVLFAMSLAWWLLAGRPRKVARIAAVFAIAWLVTLPWLGYTYSLTDRPMYWGNSGGLSLYWIASPYSGEQGDWHAYDDAPERHRPFFRSLEALGPVERDVALQEQALRFIRDEPLGYLGNLPPNVARLFFDMPYTGASVGLSSAPYAVSNGALLAAVLLCVPWLWRRRRSIPVEGRAVLLFGVVTLTFHSLLSAEPRMLVPVVPTAIWAITYAIGGSGRLSRLGDGFGMRSDPLAAGADSPRSPQAV